MHESYVQLTTPCTCMYTYSLLYSEETFQRCVVKQPIEDKQQNCAMARSPSQAYPRAVWACCFAISLFLALMDHHGKASHITQLLSSIVLSQKHMRGKEFGLAS